jgi:hypothetical protein
METSPLMDARRFARNMESVIRDAWCVWCQTDERTPVEQETSARHEKSTGQENAAERGKSA